MMTSPWSAASTAAKSADDTDAMPAAAMPAEPLLRKGAE